MARITDQAVADALLAARELMNDGGNHWIKGKIRLPQLFKRKNGLQTETCYCSIGAIQAATKGNRALRLRCYAALNKAIGRPGNAGYIGTILSWNDNYERTWSEVSRAFRRAAKLAAKGQV